MRHKFSIDMHKEQLRIEAPCKGLSYPQVVMGKDKHQSEYYFLVNFNNAPITSCDFAELLNAQTNQRWSWNMAPQTGWRRFSIFLDNINECKNPLVFFINAPWVPRQDDFVSAWTEERSENDVPVMDKPI